MTNKMNERDFGDYVVSKDTEPGQMEINENVAIDGIIAQYKANKIKQDTALQMMRKYNRSQMEVAKNKFLKAVMQNKPLSDIDADKILKGLCMNYFNSLQQLGIGNTGEYDESLIQLKQQASELLAKVDDKNLSEPMRQKSVEQIFQLIKKVDNQIMVEN